jgi:DNA-binding NtrC family response regulator
MNSPFDRPSDDQAESAIVRLRRAQAVGKLVGEAPAFRAVVEKLPALARGDATALITGETGTGKELVARALHYLSDREAFPFVPVNCGALPETLLEDNLFGHERGAFTDARDRHVGLIAQADRGTLFLDEVEGLTGRAQVALLRVLQDKMCRPLGSAGEQRVDVRFIAATNVALEQLVRRGSFRADLYYRICVLPLHLPALRERRGDILALAHHFLEKHRSRGRPEPTLSAAAEAALYIYDWPGNVRELENVIVRGISMAAGQRLEPEDMGIASASPRPADMEVTRSFQQMKRDVVSAFERDYLTRLMSEHGGNVSHAAKSAGKERRELGKLLKKYRLDPKNFVEQR